MLYFVYPKDETTEFLEPIFHNTIESIGKDNVVLLTFSLDNYQDNFDTIKNLPDGSNLIFMGHGRTDRLYGLYDLSINPFVESNKMWVFDQKNLFALACQSTDLLSKCFHRTSITYSIGFGNLPTSIEEVESIKKIKHLKMTDEDVDTYKEIIVETVSQSLIYFYKHRLNFGDMYKYLRLLLHKKMNDTVLMDSNRNIAELIFQMLNDMSYLRSVD